MKFAKIDSTLAVAATAATTAASVSVAMAPKKEEGYCGSSL